MTTCLIISGAVGLALGCVAGYVGRCRSRACLVTANPFAGAMLGLMLGLLAGWTVGCQAEPTAGVTAATMQEFRQSVLEADKPVLVDFYATWCGPCRTLSPTIDQLAEEYAGRASVVRVDVDQASEVAGEYRIGPIPTVIIFRNGAPHSRIVGAYPAETYRKALNDALAGRPGHNE